MTKEELLAIGVEDLDAAAKDLKRKLGGRVPLDWCKRAVIHLAKTNLNH